LIEPKVSFIQWDFFRQSLRFFRAF